jgi:predicted nuclease of predicted toxin-antitoxin system
MFSVEVAQALSKGGYDIVRASDTGHARADDHEILQKTVSGNRILITLDEHFGDWVILPLSRHPGVIRLKVHPTTSGNVLKILVPFLGLHSKEQFRDHLVILSEKRVKWVRTA